MFKMLSQLFAMIRAYIMGAETVAYAAVEVSDVALVAAIQMKAESLQEANITEDQLEAARKRIKSRL